MKILTNNVAGLNQMYKLHMIMRKARVYDITFLQKTKLKVSQKALVSADHCPSCRPSVHSVVREAQTCKMSRGSLQIYFGMYLANFGQWVGYV